MMGQTKSLNKFTLLAKRRYLPFGCKDLFLGNRDNKNQAKSKLYFVVKKEG